MMTEEEIEKQAEEYVNKRPFIHLLGRNTFFIQKEFRDAILWAFAEGRKEKWHDLRKDPNDLPEEDCETVTLHENGNKNIIKWKHGEWTNAIVIPVIAWYELPKFKE